MAEEKEFPFNKNYIASSSGDVFRKGKNKKPVPIEDKNGYLTVKTYLDGRYITRKIHRMVAITFIKNPLNLSEVNHKDGNKKNNQLENLEWCSKKQNMKHATISGLILKGENTPRSKLKNGEANKIRYLYKKGNITQIELGKIFSISSSQISRIINNKAYLEV